MAHAPHLRRAAPRVRRRRRALARFRPLSLAARRSLSALAREFARSLPRSLPPAPASRDAARRAQERDAECKWSAQGGKLYVQFGAGGPLHELSQRADPAANQALGAARAGLAGFRQDGDPCSAALVGLLEVEPDFYDVLGIEPEARCGARGAARRCARRARPPVCWGAAGDGSPDLTRLARVS
jgi:hypothetical protein